MAGVNPIPKDMPTLTPNLVVRGAARAIEFYKRALGAREETRMMSPDGKSVWHAQLRIGQSTVFVNDEMPGMGSPAPTAESPVPVTMWLYVGDCDAAFRRAVDAGAKPTMPPADMFWGDRCSGVADPFGYVWSFATHVRDLTEEEMRRAGEEFARSMASKPPAGAAPSQPGV
jgi:uncharacterized glyoxalase superfamily protein PhnB